MTDYIIVGCGLAGIAFAETSINAGKSVVVFDNDTQTSSTVAAGVYNPVVLKRFTSLAHAQEHLDEMNLFYDRLESKLNLKLNFRLPVLRRFTSIEDQNNWFIAADNPALAPFLSTDLIDAKFSGIESPYGFGEVLQTGYVNTAAQLLSYRNYLLNMGLLRNEFDYSTIQFGVDCVHYDDITARHIVFAEGFGIQANPYFKYLPLDGTKGELLLVRAPGLSLDVILNASLFILPRGNNLFKVGATYEWTDKSNDPTLAGRSELEAKLRDILTCDFEVVGHYAGVRPTVRDRKPLIGTHPDFPRLHILNGLGTRGVMLAPAMAKSLFSHIETGTPMERANSINRFKPWDLSIGRNS